MHGERRIVIREQLTEAQEMLLHGLRVVRTKELFAVLFYHALESSICEGLERD